MIDATVFAKRLKEARESSQLTQKELCELLHISPPSYNVYEKSGKLPSLETAASLAETLGVSLDWLLGLSSTKGNIKTYEDVISAVLAIYDSALMPEIKDIKYYLDNGEIVAARINERFLSCYDMDALVYHDNEINAVVFSFTDDTIVEFLKKFSKMDNLRLDGTIDDDLFNTWLKGEKSRFKGKLLDLPWGKTISDNESEGDDGEH